MHLFLYQVSPCNFDHTHSLGSLNSSRRRPMSVDYEINNSGKAGPSVSNQGLQNGGGSQTESNRTSHHSNRSSQPLTEREVEQGFQYFEQKNKGMQAKWNFRGQRYSVTSWVV